MNDHTLLKFHIGPVQPFIEAARTIRDLWTGSFLLSWLVFAAMKKAVSCGATILSPQVDDNPLRKLTPCLPNHFEATVPVDRAQARRFADECEQACFGEWRTIAGAVLDRMKREFPSLKETWDRDWKQQVDTFFEMRCVVLPTAEGTMKDLHQLMDTTRSVKHTPPYSPQPDNRGRYGMKCSVLGMFEQVGPADLEDGRQFWEQLAGKGFEGTTLRDGERFCAITLVKRFAWPAYLADKVGRRKDELRYSDTATVAAKIWLNKAGIDPEYIRRAPQSAGWSGQWLHWKQNPPKPDEADRGDEPCPDAVWKKIQIAKKVASSPIPSYYAVLMVDGDNVGALLSEEAKKPAGVSITRRLSVFALTKVEPIVERDHFGELIYAGGDDVLAVTPTPTALSTARALYDCYRSAEVMGSFPKATMSAGVVIAHYKEDLRFVLEQARQAERDAKNAGRDRLTLRILRRSGEHSSVVLPWNLVAGNQRANLQQLVQSYIGDSKGPAPSDRWAYRLRAELPALQQSKEIFETEMRRLLSRLELAKDRLVGFRDLVLHFFEDFFGAFPKDEMLKDGVTVLSNFVTACQSASFLARGRDA